MVNPLFQVRCRSLALYIYSRLENGFMSPCRNQKLFIIIIIILILYIVSPCLTSNWAKSANHHRQIAQRDKINLVLFRASRFQFFNFFFLCVRLLILSICCHERHTKKNYIKTTNFHGWFVWLYTRKRRWRLYLYIHL
jgi:hypothetical protein